MKMTEKKIHIAILDSGVCIGHPALLGINMNGCTLQYDEQKKRIVKKKDFSDEVGHGTAVTSLIAKIAPNAEERYNYHFCI